jgi:hypothetical protein
VLLLLLPQEVRVDEILGAEEAAKVIDHFA